MTEAAEVMAPFLPIRPDEGAMVTFMRGMRKAIATRMHQSLRDTAQLETTDASPGVLLAE